MTDEQQPQCHLGRRRDQAGVAVTGRQPLIYVAGPITSAPLAAVRESLPAFDRLLSLGAVPIMPQWSVVAELVAGRPYESWMEYDFRLISRCDGLARLPGRSPGADREVAYASGLGLPWWNLAAGEEAWDQVAQWLDDWSTS